MSMIYGLRLGLLALVTVLIVGFASFLAFHVKLAVSYSEAPKPGKWQWM